MPAGELEPLSGRIASPPIHAGKVNVDPLEPAHCQASGMYVASKLEPVGTMPSGKDSLRKQALSPAHSRKSVAMLELDLEMHAAVSPAA
ncbi:hypothetical protein E2562_010341 [Oryza meyeriana var. granulata]|uniref:Uncharacterized protein n=1 Tax=Oryza meyeriana var. granulata TaxID=110450 RepID=A0A6G1F677_9ORYZ|nr:hypothetical protein E2562_010341 [Oryza meyeriana var. granulata]